ncbi:MAG: ATP-binding protein [Christensenellales bacterium]|jgi:hypothetical protein
MKRITIFCGNFGSGKTEIAIQTALDMAPRMKTVLVDLDIVNPYFRSYNQKALLQAHHVRVIGPALEGNNTELRPISGEVYGIFGEPELFGVLDVGGDPAGAVALGRFSSMIRQVGYDMQFVINIRRPLTGDAERILALMAQIEASARLEVTGIVNNTNLALETSPQDVLEGQEVCRQVARERNLPITGIYAMPGVIEALPEDFKAEHKGLIKPLTIRMRQPWMDSR